jgi:hypothetical protein
MGPGRAGRAFGVRAALFQKSVLSQK